MSNPVDFSLTEVRLSYGAGDALDWLARLDVRHSRDQAYLNAHFWAKFNTGGVSGCCMLPCADRLCRYLGLRVVESMMKLHMICALLCVSASAATAQSLGEKIIGGIQKGAEAVGEGASNVAGAVEGSVNSTKELFSSEDDPSETRARLDATADRSITRLFEEQPQSIELYEQAVGYAVFDVRKVTLVGFSGGAGRGVAWDQGNNRRVYMNMSTAGVGLALGIGGFESQLVIFFKDNTGFEQFVTNGFDASANAGSMVGDEKSEVEIQFRDGRAVFVLTKKGWRVAATATGSKFWPDADMN